MRLSTAIKDYCIEIEIRKYTPKTIKGYRTNLGLFLRFCEEMGEGDRPFRTKDKNGCVPTWYASVFWYK